LQDLTRTELFLVEGDSAGGSAKQARDRNTQAIMPLRGKILNTWEVHSNEILSSQEIHDIAVAIGVDPGSQDLTGLRYGKICVLADADSDGLHIATLLCALFVKHFRPLVASGHVFIAMPPLYRIDFGKEVYYALDEAEKGSILHRVMAGNKKAKPNVQRFKGLGEMNPVYGLHVIRCVIGVVLNVLICVFVRSMALKLLPRLALILMKFLRY
jgi:topoisomerase-4 subunit B